MKGFLILVCLLGLAGPSAALSTATAGFASPAQGQGDLVAHGAQWALMVFHEAIDTSFAVSLEGPTVVTNRTTVQQKTDWPGVATGTLGRDVPSMPTTMGDVAGTLAIPPRPWASLYIEARRLSLSLDSVAAQVMAARGERWAEDYLPKGYAEGDVTHDRGVGAHPVGVAVAATSLQPDAQIPFALSASGVRRIEWHNATLACLAETDCPDSGQPWSTPVESGGTHWIQRLSYIRIESSGGSLSGGGAVWGLAFGGEALDLGVDGRVRLPDASIVGACPGGPCPDPEGRTFLAEGDLSLFGLRRFGADRLQARLGGDVDSAAFDESPRWEYTAAGAAVGAVGLVVLLKALAAFFARAARPPALQHPRRRQLHDVVNLHPGLSYRDLQRRLGWANGTLQRHLKRLTEDGHIVAQPYKNSVRYFPNHGRYERTWRQVAQGHDADGQRLLDWLAAHPGCRQADVLRQTGQWGWSRTATQRRLRDLNKAGLLRTQRHGRTTHYHATPA